MADLEFTIYPADLVFIREGDPAPEAGFRTKRIRGWGESFSWLWDFTIWFDGGCWARGCTDRAYYIACEERLRIQHGDNREALMEVDANHLATPEDIELTKRQIIEWLNQCHRYEEGGIYD